PAEGLLIHDLCYSPDGRTLALACADGTVRFWDPALGKEIRAFDWNVGGVFSLAFSPDGMTCAAGGTGGRVGLWDGDGVSSPSRRTRSVLVDGPPARVFQSSRSGWPFS